METWEIIVTVLSTGTLGIILTAIAKFWNQVKGISVKDILKQDNKEALETVKEATKELGNTINTQSKLIKEILKQRELEKEKDKENGDR